MDALGEYEAHMGWRNLKILGLTSDVELIDMCENMPANTRGVLRPTTQLTEADVMDMAGFSKTMLMLKMFIVYTYYIFHK